MANTFAVYGRTWARFEQGTGQGLVLCAKDIISREKAHEWIEKNKQATASYVILEEFGNEEPLAKP